MMAYFFTQWRYILNYEEFVSGVSISLASGDLRNWPFNFESHNERALFGVSPLVHIPCSMALPLSIPRVEGAPLFGLNFRHRPHMQHIPSVANSDIC